MATIGRDPFARQDVIRETVPQDERKPCSWCGCRPGRFRYGVDPDSGHKHLLKGAFCCISCCRDYNDIDLKAGY